MRLFFSRIERASLLTNAIINTKKYPQVWHKQARSAHTKYAIATSQMQNVVSCKNKAMPAMAKSKRSQLQQMQKFMD